MKADFYATPKSKPLMRMFWQAAGGDRYILDRATYSDQIKYMCLGGIVVATGVMAAIAGGYAFYTIFEPRGSALESDYDFLTIVLSTIFGLIWGLIIFNIDRFIVTSTGKGDGTEAITWGELKSALPRIIMGAIIALTISKPVEIRMFKSEIDVELHKSQMQKQQEYLSNIEATFEGRIATEREKIVKWETEIQAKENRYVELENLLADEMGGNRGARGYGPEAQKLEQQLQRLDGEIKILKAKNAPLITEGYNNLKLFEQQKLADIDNGEKVAAGLDGLLMRIKLAHEIAGTWISLFITLLFMAIELTPIFFKLMLTKSPYDYLEENTKELMKAKQGIYIQYNYYKDKQGLERDLVRFLNVEKEILQQEKLLEAQKRLTDYAISKYEEQIKRKIDISPESFIRLEAPDVSPILEEVPEASITTTETTNAEVLEEERV
ncbi:DUF4407 domain-containing protein [Pontibacter pamirensis]|uniref:DUF4407 domain-containing protein n=1 Tax=Pontibacter pamirensis TaxID=2562824 RepID=UPI00138A388C|nr:DUF4407 domain-containing protein [Pontibacter pamirensis]